MYFKAKKTNVQYFQPEMPYEPEADPEADEEQEAPDIHTLKKNFELLHTNPNQGIYPLKQTKF